MPSSGALRDRVHDHAPDRGQHRVDPLCRAHRRRPRTGQHRCSGRRIGTRHRPARVRQPGHEQAQLPGTRLPVAARPGAPPQEQRDASRISLRRRFRAVPAEPNLPQERIRDRHDSQLLIQHRPVTHPGRQPHHERSHPVIPRSRASRVNIYQPRAPHARRSAAKRHPCRVGATWCNGQTRPRRTQPVHRFDPPLAAGDAGQVRGPGAVCVQAGDGVHDLLGDQRAGEVVAVAADPRDLGGVREVDLVGVGGPDGALDDPAVAVVQLDVVRLARSVMLDGVVDGALQAGLVALDWGISRPR